MSPIVHIINLIVQMIVGLASLGWILFVVLETMR